jgi:hypothetical protein
MLNLPQNINKRERIVRGVVGALLIIGVIIGQGAAVAFLLGVILIAFAALNYCGIIDIIERFKLDGGSGSSENKS